MGSRNLKTIKGRDYLYYVVSENGKKRAIYCGLASKLESKKKATQLELEHLENQRKNISQKIIEIEDELRIKY